MELDIKQIHHDWIDGISGEAFAERVHLHRAQLEALPPEAQARGALISEADPIQFAAAFFATASLRIPVILANPNWGTQEWDEFRSLVSPAVSFGRGFIPMSGGLGGWDAPDSGMAPVRHSSKSDGGSRAPTGSILIPTGGTTGGVKLAIHSWASLQAACRGVEDFLGGGPINSCCVLPLYHVSGLMQLLRAFHSGGHIRFHEDPVAGRCLSYVPTQLQRALACKERIRKLMAARTIFVGGAALPESLAERVRALKLPIVPVYGLTETAAMIAAVPNRDFLENIFAGAVPLGKAQFQIESRGRLRIRSETLFQGYQGWSPIDKEAGYLTDDEARLDADGRLHVVGRMDRLINSGGEKIDPAEVEAEIGRFAGVREVLVVGVPDKEWGQKVVAYYTAAEDEAPSDWKARLRKTLAACKVPKSLIRVDVLPSVGASPVIDPELIGR